MLDVISELLAKEGIGLVRPVPLADCHIVRPYLLERAGIAEGTVFLFAIPYLSPSADKSRNLSAYAVPRDYHAYLTELSERILPVLREKYPDERFALFGDHSPISELHAAGVSGLGVLGKNRMLITKPYSSFVFLAEIITSYRYDCRAVKPGTCMGCGRCTNACAYLGRGEGECLSALSQKKGTLTKEEEDALLFGGSVWGCDRCQEVCPYTDAARRAGTLYTTIPYFLTDTITHLTSEEVRAMREDEFSHRAFAWRGKATILRNLALFEEAQARGTGNADETTGGDGTAADGQDATTNGENAATDGQDTAMNGQDATADGEGTVEDGQDTRMNEENTAAGGQDAATNEENTAKEKNSSGGDGKENTPC